MPDHAFFVVEKREKQGVVPVSIHSTDKSAKRQTKAQRGKVVKTFAVFEEANVVGKRVQVIRTGAGKYLVTEPYEGDTVLEVKGPLDGLPYYRHTGLHTLQIIRPNAYNLSDWNSGYVNATTPLVGKTAMPVDFSEYSPDKSVYVFEVDEGKEAYVFETKEMAERHLANLQQTRNVTPSVPVTLTNLDAIKYAYPEERRTIPNTPYLLGPPQTQRPKRMNPKRHEKAVREFAIRDYPLPSGPYRVYGASGNGVNRKKGQRKRSVSKKLSKNKRPRQSASKKKSAKKKSTKKKSAKKKRNLVRVRIY